MSKNQAIDFSGMDDIIKNLTDLEKDVHGVIEQALLETARKTTARLKSVASDPSVYPSKGRYASGETSQKVREPEVIWKSQDSGYVIYGFDSSDYKVPYYVMYGTDKYNASQKLRNAVMSATIKKDFEVDLEEALQKAVDNHD